MIQNLKKAWAVYRSWPLWKQLVLLVPAIMAVVLGIFLAITSDPAREAIEQLVNYHKGKVDEQVANNDQQGEALARKVKELEAKAEAVRNEIKENEQATKETMDDIDRAVNAGDLRELERIRRRLNNR